MKNAAILFLENVLQLKKNFKFHVV